MSHKLVSTQKPHRDVYSGFIHECQNLEATKMFFNKWLHKLGYIKKKLDYYSALKRNELSDHEKAKGNFKCIFLGEISQSEKTTYVWSQVYDILEKTKL